MRVRHPRKYIKIEGSLAWEMRMISQTKTSERGRKKEKLGLEEVPKCGVLTGKYN